MAGFCKVCGIRLMGGKPRDRYMPCGVAPRHYVSISRHQPMQVVAIIPGCPFEAAKDADFLPAGLMYYFDGDEKPEFTQNVEAVYADPKDFRAARHRQNHTNADLVGRDDR